MTAEDVDAQERAYFVQWRRELARLEEEEKLVLTPFEKNLEVWRQLWRVLERSHIVVQVQDYHWKSLAVPVAPSKWICRLSGTIFCGGED